MLTMGQALTAQARLQPGRIGARDLDRTMSFGLWNAGICRLANALAGLGPVRGDRVAVLAYNRIEWLEIYPDTRRGASSVSRTRGGRGPRIRHPAEMRRRRPFAPATAIRTLCVVSSSRQHLLQRKIAVGY